jgi:hypothetical protein
MPANTRFLLNSFKKIREMAGIFLWINSEKKYIDWLNIEREDIN